MARPNKDGLDYFPLDVDFLNNEKILAISGEFAVKGEIIVVRLLCEIYYNGYFVEYTELLKNKLARLGGLSAGLIDEVVKRLVDYDFFDKIIFREHKVLTSINIQKVYVEAVKRRKNVEMPLYNLLKPVNVDINEPASIVNVDINAQSKGKESKVKESKEEEKAQPFSFLNSLVSIGADSELAKQWVKVRKTKRAVNTQIAFNGFYRELLSSGKDVNDILRECVERSWAGFKAEWIAEGKKDKGNEITCY